jgi:hypothetical protein
VGGRLPVVEVMMTDDCQEMVLKSELDESQALLRFAEHVAEQAELRANVATAELQAWIEALKLMMGANAPDALSALERIKAALLARGGF